MKTHALGIKLGCASTANVQPDMKHLRADSERVQGMHELLYANALCMQDVHVFKLRFRNLVQCFRH